MALFPEVPQPFLIFEPRYREMVADALVRDSLIGMVLLKPGFEADYEGRPPIYEVGCAGRITRAEELPDGRWEIVVEGVVKFRITGEDDSRAYRLARVDELAEPVSEEERERLAEARRRVVAALLAVAPNTQPPPHHLTDVVVINTLALLVPRETEERQALLEEDGPLARAEMLIQLIEALGTSRDAAWMSLPSRPLGGGRR